MERENPTAALNVSFADYVAGRKATLAAHMDGLIPDYAYGPDLACRQKLSTMPGFYAFAKALTTTYVPMCKQQLNMTCLKVGPSQYPEVYACVVDCARRLGIGVPMCFVEPSASTINAYTYAMEDDEPVVVVTSALVERMSPEELRAVIGHECGHIHNNHGVFNVAVDRILSTLQSSVPVVGDILNLLSVPIQVGLRTWQRAAEVTCDRAGVICSTDPEASIRVQAKLISGAGFDTPDVDVDAVLEQYDMLRSTPTRYLEIVSYDHPLSVRRIFAIQEFLRSETLLSWRPEWRDPDQTYIGKQELELRCERYIGVTKNGERGR